MERASDTTLWEFARDEGYVLVSKDDDFRDIQLLRGHPPKLIVLRLGNASNAAVLDALTGASTRVIATLAQPEVGIVELF